MADISIYGCGECGWFTVEPDEVPEVCHWCGNPVEEHVWDESEWEVACMERRAYEESQDRLMAEVDGSWDY